MALLQKSPHDLVISDLKMPEMSGLDLLRRIRSEYPDTVVVMITAFGTVGTAVEAMKAGAYDYITKPVHADELELVVRRSLEHLDLLEENRILRSSLDGKYGFDEHHRTFEITASCAGYVRAGGSDGRDRADPGGNRNREGVARQGGTFQLLSPGEAVCDHQLRRNPAGTAGVRIVRPCEGVVHRGCGP